LFCKTSIDNPLTAEATILFLITGKISAKTKSTWYGFIVKIIISACSIQCVLSVDTVIPNSFKCSILLTFRRVTVTLLFVENLAIPVATDVPRFPPPMM
jgi:hypothetical protein